MNVLFVLPFALVLAGCATRPLGPPGAITASEVTNDKVYIDWYKTWHMQLTDEVQMNMHTTLQPWLEKCSTWTGCGSFALEFSYELKQRNDAWVVFDCDNVADKIIDRDLVPKVQAACKILHATATEYWVNNNDPSQFTDSDGRIWHRQ